MTGRVRRAARGFSLVEILIAILVLAFGLLGLAALFPVVVTQQRDAADLTLGPAAGASVRASIFGTSEVADWEAVFTKLNPNTRANVAPPAGTGRWHVNEGAQSGLATPKIIDVNPDGSIELRTPTRQVIPVSARMQPSVYGSVPPQFVWDVALRRASTAGPLEVAVFVRRIDPGIRVPEGKTLVNVLTGWGLDGSSPVPPRAVPIAVDPGSGRPTSNGVGDYAGLREARVRPVDTGRGVADRFELSGLEPLERNLIARVGQKLLDDLGVLRTVTGTDSADGELRVVVEPAFPSDEDFRWVVYSPQPPVSVEIVRIGGAP